MVAGDWGRHFIVLTVKELRWVFMPIISMPITIRE
jgi:hypothetical protein